MAKTLRRWQAPFLHVFSFLNSGRWQKWRSFFFFTTSPFFHVLVSSLLTVSNYVKPMFNQPCLRPRAWLKYTLVFFILVPFGGYLRSPHLFSRVLEVECSPRGIEYHNRFMSLGVFPIGIDPEHVARTLRKAWVQNRIKEASVRELGGR